MSFNVGDAIWLWDGINNPIKGTVSHVDGSGNVMCDLPCYKNMSLLPWSSNQVYKRPEDLQKLNSHLVYRVHELMRCISQVMNDVSE